jgi:L-seryl-tRNA(Ser) seleniumtransferase
MNAAQAEAWRQIPSLDRVLASPEMATLITAYPRDAVVETLRAVLDECRQRIRAGEEVTPDALSPGALARTVEQRLAVRFAPALRRVINTTGTVIHTNLGRSLLSEWVCEQMSRVASHYINLEYDLEGGERSHRDYITEGLLCELTGAEAATVVNNNAAAVLLCLNTMAQGREVIVSRGELIEIGGAFRIPDVMASSGAILREVGTTNRTHARDYRNAINENTGLLLKVHPSNYAILGFTSSVDIADLVVIGRERGIPTMEDLGSGALVDLSQYGLPKEPVVLDQVAVGTDLITFSGDKLLGGPQAGIIVGKPEWIERIRKNPLMRALRLSKLTISALEATLRLYRRPELLRERLPTLRMLARPLDEIAAVAAQVRDGLAEAFGDTAEVTVVDGQSQVGSGSFPIEALPSKCIAIAPRTRSAEAFDAAFRRADPPVIARIRDDCVLMDLRTVTPEEGAEIVAAARKMKGMRDEG